MNWVVIALLFIPYFAFASQRVVAGLSQFYTYDRRLHGVLMALALVIPYLLAERMQGVAGRVDVLLDLGKMLA